MQVRVGGEHGVGRVHHVGAALQVGDPEGHAAQVLVDPAAVATEPDQFAVVGRRLLQGDVEGRLVLVEQRREPSEFIDRAGQRRTRLVERLFDALLRLKGR